MKNPLHSIETFFAHEQIKDDYGNIAGIIQHSRMRSNLDIERTNRNACIIYVDRIIANKKILGMEFADDIVLRNRIVMDFKNILQSYPAFR